MEPNIQLTICDLRDDCVASLRKRFAGLKSVTVEKCDITKSRKDAWATAGNSFGDMGGGVDRAIDNYFSGAAQDAVQAAIRKQYFNELPVGSAVAVRPLPGKPLLIYAPTMRVPGSIQGTINAYLSMRAILITAIRERVSSLACPALGTGVGGISTEDAADQMYQAYRLIVLGEFEAVRHSLMAPYAMR